MTATYFWKYITLCTWQIFCTTAALLHPRPVILCLIDAHVRTVISHVFACALFLSSGEQAAQSVKEVMAGDGRVNPVYRQMVVLAVRSGAAGAARYFKPEGQNSTTQADDRALTKVRFREHHWCLFHGNV